MNPLPFMNQNLEHVPNQDHLFQVLLPASTNRRLHQEPNHLNPTKLLTTWQQLLKSAQQTQSRLLPLLRACIGHVR